MTGTNTAATYLYDDAGRLTSRADAAGTTSFEWTARGELDQLTDPLTGSIFQYDWSAASQLNSISYITGGPQRTFDAVGGLDELAESMRGAGVSLEDIARAMHAQRRSVGELFKDLTPEPLQTQIFDRNIRRYGDPPGPSVDWLRAQGKTWEEIIEGATRTGGQDLGF